jgi:hypothetical protein
VSGVAAEYEFNVVVLEELRWRGLMEQDAGGRLWLVTGTIIDALEVPRSAGVVSMSWWRYTRGDEHGLAGPAGTAQTG